MQTAQKNDKQLEQLASPLTNNKCHIDLGSIELHHKNKPKPHKTTEKRNNERGHNGKTKMKNKLSIKQTARQ